MVRGDCGDLLNEDQITPDLIKIRIMMSKITSLKGAFKGVVMYATQEHKHYEIVLSNGVRTDTPEHTIADFHMQASQNQHIQKNCMHIILSHHPDDGRKIAGKEPELLTDYLDGLKRQGIDFKETQYIIYKHNDKGHEHYHMVANMVNNEARRFNDSHIGYKAKYTSKEITKQYGLTPAVNKLMQKMVMEQSYNIGQAIKLLQNPAITMAQEIIKPFVKAITSALDEETELKKGRGMGGFGR